MSKFKVGMVSLGCDKNRVDSELILGSINKFYEITNNPKEAEIIIINTCGFIESAKQESIDTILEMAEYKKTHKCKMIIATGCLTQRYGDELLELIPEIDILMGVNDYMKLHKLIVDFIKTEQRVSSTTYKDEGVNEGERILTTNSHTAYLRIAEGCNNFCTYCIIPKIRGKFRSRSKESILAEATSLVNQGVKEIILIAQDLTNYGEDLYGKNELHVLINEISNIKGLEWIRLLYCYPEEITDELIEVIANNPKVMKYLDLPIQHISNNILKMMARKTNKETIIGKINLLREKVPGITLRTSLIVGFPGETEEDFNELCRFLKNYKLDNVGVFTYSQEEGTAAAKLPNQVDEDVKIKRKEKLMNIQRGIVKDLNKLKIGNIYDTIIDGSTGEYYIGRNYEMAPEIDGLIYITKGKVLKKGDIIKVKITNIMEYDWWEMFGMNLANKLTLLRVILVPVFLIFLIGKGIPYGSIIATLIFIIASLTDQLDGYIARSRNQITNFGKFMDPLADKLLVTAALISLVELHLIPSWAAVIIIAREFAVSGLRTVAASEGIVIAASWWGKIKTVTQIIAILLLLLQFNIESIQSLNSSFEASAFLNNFFAYAPKIALFIAVAMTIISGIDYFIKNKGAISTNK